jgi:DNA-binding SARP family transcriptional activator
MAVLCCERGERAATLEWLAEAERHPGDWFEHPTGIEFLADAAVCAERVGEVAVADRHLELARDRAQAAGFPDMVWFATGVINARRGEPELAVKVLTQLLDEPWPPPRDRWVVWLHLALARLRAGDESGAVQDAARAFEAASVLVGTGRAAATREDLAEVLIRLQPDVVARLAPIVASTGSPLVDALHSIRPRLRLFGGLSVQLGTGLAAVPPGRPALLLMLVAITTGPLTMDAAIEELWPGVSSELGRRRMRNVLARLRASCGDLLVRNGETLALAPGTVVDVTEFELACDRVERALPSDRPALARAALALNERPLLPEAAYAPRVSRVRDGVDRRSLELLEIVATDAERNHRLDDAVAALARKADVDPYDAATPARIAALATRAGRPGQAAFWHQRALSLDDD